MGKIQKEFQTSYKPIPYKPRFWIHSENCYTEEDLNFREWVLKIRANSGIHPDYLSNPSSWFSEDSQALINVYEKAWIYSNAFKTRHVLTRDDFHVQPVDSQRLQWPALYDLMQNVGDYLLIRNQLLPDEHLNQPMNFIFLDINYVLKGLSQNPNSVQVKEQLDILNRYLRTIEKKISPMVGSDRLFLANFRRVIDDQIEPQFTHLIESQLLKERLGNLSKNIKQLSMERNRILHFALNINPVNPHPYEFAITDAKNSEAYPTRAAKECGQHADAVSTQRSDNFQLTGKQLQDCPHFKLISMDADLLGHYAKAISDLYELHRFQTVIAQTMSLLDQAGEVYTIHQFKKQMLALLNQINVFVDDSSTHIQEIIHANTQAYHDAIQVEQNLSVWRQWFSDEKEKLKNFIKNQDTLSQFPSSAADLAKTNGALKEQVTQVISHLSQPSTKETSFEAIAEQAQELNQLMGSMHNWIKNQYKIKGLANPPAPEPVRQIKEPLLTTSSLPIPLTAISHNLSRPDLHYAPLFTPVANINACPENDQQCRGVTQSETNIHLMGYLGLVTIIPLSLIVLYLLMPRKNEQEKPLKTDNKSEYKELKVKFEDLMTQMNGLEKTQQPKFLDDYQKDYEELKRKVKRGIYNVDTLEELCIDIESELEAVDNKRRKS